MVPDCFEPLISRLLIGKAVSDNPMKTTEEDLRSTATSTGLATSPGGDHDRLAEKATEVKPMLAGFLEKLKVELKADG